MKKYFLIAVVSVISVFFAGASEKAIVNISTDSTTSKISRYIYGQFAEHLGHCIYGGIWVGENSNISNIKGYRTDVVNALKDISVPVLRWPGGCFADEYHWMDGIGPRAKRPKMVNTNWGGVVEDNSFGTHEFLNFCELIGTEPYISGNVGSGTVEEMSKWVEYITSGANSPMANLRRENGRDKPWKVKFWGVGNESWGCGGSMTPQYYSDVYRRYQTFCRNYGDNRLCKIACGANTSDYNWTKTLMKNCRRNMWGLSLHYYTVPRGWGKGGKGSATDFDEKEYMTTMQKASFMDELVTKHSQIMDKYDPKKKVSLCVDEWGAWYDVEPGTNPGFLYQQNTLRDALLAAMTMNIFNKHSDRIRMANIAQMVNVLQAMILTKEDKMVLTPTYYIYKMYKVHQDAENLPVEIDSPVYSYGTKNMEALSVSASKDSSGKIHVSIVNVDPENDIKANINLKGGRGKSVKGVILTSDNLNDHNTFEDNDKVMLEDFAGAKIKGDLLSVKIPAKSVITLEIN